MRGAPLSQRSPWYATPVVAASVLLGVPATSDVLDWSGAWRSIAALLGLLTLTLVATRLLSRSRALPTVVAAAVAVLAMIPMFVTEPTGGRSWLPTPGTLGRLGAAVVDGVKTLNESVPPVPVDGSVTAVVAALCAAIFLVAEHLAVSWRAAASAGLILVTLWLPAAVLQWRLTTVIVLTGIGLWLALLTLTARAGGRNRGPRLRHGAFAVAAVLGGVALVSPVLIGGPWWGFLPGFASGASPDGTTQLDLDLDLRDSLTVNSSTPVLLYISDGERPSALRTHTFTSFDGTAWSRPSEPGASQAVQGVLWPTPVPSWNGQELTRIGFQTLGFEGANLPLPVTPRSVLVEGDFSYVPSSDEVVTSTSSLKDLQYTVDTALDYVSAGQLIDLGDANAEDVSLDPVYLEIPEAVDGERLLALGQQITAGSASRYDTAVALQEYFRNVELFTYDTTVEPHGTDSVSVFLDERRGYCVQFASTMVMMSRALGIPARLAIGFLPGTEDPSGGFLVRGKDAHAWPELYFESIGWVRFEPTPSVQTGPRPAYADPVDAPSEAPQDPSAVPSPVAVDPSAGATLAPGASPSPDDLPVEPEPSGALPWPLLAGAIVLALAAAGLAWAWLRRRKPAPTLEAEWERLRRSVPAAATWELTHTPAEARAAWVAAHQRGDVDAGGAADDAVAELAAAVEERRYSPDASHLDPERARALVDLVIAAFGKWADPVK